MSRNMLFTLPERLNALLHMIQMTSYSSAVKILRPPNDANQDEAWE